VISLFTTTKDFVGPDAVHQLNALRSWKAAPVDVEIFVCGESQGLASVVQELRLHHVREVATSSHGVPLVNSMFDVVSQRSSNDICCFVNADIILPFQFFQSVATIHRLAQQPYLIVGQRNDVDVDERIEFVDDWEEIFLWRHRFSLKEHPPTGSDFFVFPKGQYQLNDIPDLIVERWGWDLWMIHHARTQGTPTIDLSATTRVIHQNHQYAHKSESGISEDTHNLSLLPAKSRFLFHLLACDYSYQNGQLAENFARGDYKYYLKIERQLGRRAFYKLFRHWSTSALRWVGAPRTGQLRGASR